MTIDHGNSLGVYKRFLAAGHRIHGLQVYSKGGDLGWSSDRMKSKKGKRTPEYSRLFC